MHPGAHAAREQLGSPAFIAFLVGRTTSRDGSSARPVGQINRTPPCPS
jgi:hypothetical protein